jgi:hypothetical protein
VRGTQGTDTGPDGAHEDGQHYRTTDDDKDH